MVNTAFEQPAKQPTARQLKRMRANEERELQAQLKALQDAKPSAPGKGDQYPDSGKGGKGKGESKGKDTKGFGKGSK